MAGLELSDEALVAALRAHPDLRERVASIVLAVEGDEGQLKEADAAEERLVEEMRVLDGRRCALGPRTGSRATMHSSTTSDASPR